MNLRLLQLPKLIAERRSSAIFGMVIIAMLWAGVFLKYAGDVQEDKREAERTNRNFAMVFEENVLRSIGEIDKALLYLRRSIETRKRLDRFPDHRQHDRRVERDHRPGRNHRRQRHHARIERRPAARSGLGFERPGALQGPCRQPTRIRLFISKPVIGRASGKWSVQFSRRFLNAMAASPGSSWPRSIPHT